MPIQAGLEIGLLLDLIAFRGLFYWFQELGPDSRSFWLDKKKAIRRRTNETINVEVWRLKRELLIGMVSERYRNQINLRLALFFLTKKKVGPSSFFFSSINIQLFIGDLVYRFIKKVLLLGVTCIFSLTLNTYISL